MVDWIWRNAETLSALAAVFTLLSPALYFIGKRLLRMLMSRLAKSKTDRAQIAAMMATVEKMGRILMPEGEPPLNNQIADIKQWQHFATDSMAITNRRLAGMVARQRYDWTKEKDPLFEMDTTGQILFVNQAFLDLVGRESREVMGRGWESLLYPETRMSIQTEWDAAVTAKRGYQASFVIRTRGRGDQRVVCVVEPLRCETDLITGFVGRYIEFKPVT